MTLIKLFNVYQGNHMGALHKDYSFHYSDPNFKGIASKCHRTVTGPFDSVEDAKASIAQRGCVEDFLQTIEVKFDVGEI